MIYPHLKKKKNQFSKNFNLLYFIFKIVIRVFFLIQISDILNSRYQKFIKLIICSNFPLIISKF